MHAIRWMRRWPEGVCHARTDRGRELPVLDVTHPAFALDVNRAELEEAAESMRGESSFFLGAVGTARPPAGTARRAPGKARTRTGMATYVAKLGDQRGWSRLFLWMRPVSGALLAESVRLRAHGLPRLLAAGMVPALADRPEAPLDLVNIAGGAASDSLNALILLARDRPFLLAGRTVRIHVLDVDAAAPHFAARALAALRAPGAPLQRVDATLEHLPYDWDRPAELGRHLEAWRASNPVMAGSSEGGLLEYGSDEAVVENLRVLRAGVPPRFVLACSAWRDDGLTQAMASARACDHSLRPRTHDALRALADQAEWNVQWGQEENPLHHLLLLRPR